jgi:ATP-dependent DNA helicase RecG
VVDILKTKYFTSPIHYEGMQRIEKLEVPEDALREILYNAIAHKDYMGAPIQMRVWDDYVEVWNEGSLPKELTPEALLRHHSSHPRNKNIAYAFFKAGFIESWGRGYKKIREGFEKAGLPMPKIEDVEGGVRVTFQRNNVSNSSKDELIKNISNENKRELSDVLKNVLKNVQKKDLEKLTERQIDVLEFIVQTPTITFKEMSKRLKVSVKTIQRDFTAMGLLGINIVRKDGKTYGEWVIK